MANKKKKKEKLTIREALSTLSQIVDLDNGDLEEVLPIEGIKSTRPLTDRVTKGHERVSPLPAERIKDIFNVILEYFKTQVEKESDKNRHSLLERARTVMVLVGEAADKLDNYKRLFDKKNKKSVTQFSEYKRLQDFYSRKIEKQVDEWLLSKWVVGLSKAGPSKKALRKARERKKEKSRHVFVDLEMVKKDTEYELLLMRKEDGSRFYSPRLLRNIKLVCDFGGYSGKEKDILLQIYDWRELICHVGALHMLKTLHLPLKRFYHEAYRHKGKDMAGAMNKAIMALMLCANSNNLSKYRGNGEEKKSCSDYFEDFQGYLREALNTRYYQRLLAYPPKKSNVLANCLIAVVQKMCYSLYSHLNLMQELHFCVEDLIEEAESEFPPTTTSTNERGIFVWSRLAYDYGEIMKALRRHSNGPLKRILESLEDGRHTAFDSLMQFNLPHVLYDIQIDGERVTNLRIASPTRQVIVNKPVVNDEFKGFLLAKGRKSENRKHLLLNLQDRTSWREFPRCDKLEKLQTTNTYKNAITVVTLATDTPFYHQNAGFETQEDVEKFFATFKNQISDSSSGFFFPDKVFKEIFPLFTEALMGKIHKVFFNEERFLSKRDRQNFITLFYLFLTLKIIEIIEPNSFSFSCKDAIDTGITLSVELFVFLKMLKKSDISKIDMDYVKAMIYGPSLLIRERVMLPDAVNRMIGVLQVIEHLKESLGGNDFKNLIDKNFSQFYSKPILNAKLFIPVKERVREKEEAA